ncbi:MAG: ATP-binding protein [Eubacteriales bacterium]
MHVLNVDADVKLLEDVNDFLNEVLVPLNCPADIQFQIEVALEEIYSNIAYYAYPNEIGPTMIYCKVEEEEGKPYLLILEIEDKGIPYNPLDQEDPDITLSCEEREIGGLGIFLVKNSMDFVSYRHENGANIFTIKKYLGYENKE